MPSQRFWRSILSACAATLAVAQQVFTQATVAQAIPQLPIKLTRPYPSSFPALWTGYSESDFLSALHANAEAACESLAVYRGRAPNQYKAVVSPDNTRATCYIGSLPVNENRYEVFEFTYPICPQTELQDWGKVYYVYTGGFNGECKLINNGITPINFLVLPALGAAELYKALVAAGLTAASLNLLADEWKKNPPPFLNESTNEGQPVGSKPTEEDLSKPWGDLIKDAIKVSKPSDDDEIWEKPGKPGLDKADKDFDSLNLGSVKDINTSYGPGRVGYLPDGTSVGVRPNSPGPNGRPTIQIDRPKIQGKTIKIRY